MSEHDFKREYEATHVTISETAFDKNNEFVDYYGTFAIALDCGDYVWVHANYSHAFKDECMRVGDGRNNGFSTNGDCIVSVPVKHIKKFLTEEEAMQIEEMYAIDRKMLSYAR